MLPSLLATFVGLILCWFCVTHHGPHIQADILARTGQAFEAAKIPAAGLSVDGRDVLLKGVQGSREVSDEAHDTAAAVWGVRTVQVETTPLPLPPPAPAPARAAVTAVQDKLNDIVRLRNIEFRVGSADLTPEGSATLDQVAAALQKASALTVSISGHTDASGGPAANLTLSQARAASVKTYLVSKGVVASRLTATGFGQTKPVADNATPDGRQRNRRIEFGVTGGGQAEIVPTR